MGERRHRGLSGARESLQKSLRRPVLLSARAALAPLLEAAKEETVLPKVGAKGLEPLTSAV